MSMLPGTEEALAPVRAAMLREARERAAAIVGKARQDAARLIEQARRDAAAAVAQGAADGRAQAAPVAAEQLSRGRREARARLLRAQRGSLDELRRLVREAVATLPGEPGYDRLLARLTSAARRAAGPGATVAPHQAGGVVATAPGVLVDCSLPRLADQAVDTLGPEVAQLWTARPDGTSGRPPATSERAG